MFPLEFRAEVNRKETRVMGHFGHSCSARAKRTLFSAKSERTLLCERLKLIINALFYALYFRNERANNHGFGTIPACDRRSDGQTESIVANTPLCVAMLTRYKIHECVRRGI